MGICTSQKKPKPKSTNDLIMFHEINYVCTRFNCYLDLIGETRFLGFYLQEKIQELRVLQQKLQTCSQSEKYYVLQEASTIVEFLYHDKHFSQAFPILRESLKEVILHTTLGEL